MCLVHCSVMLIASRRAALDGWLQMAFKSARDRSTADERHASRGRRQHNTTGSRARSVASRKLSYNINVLEIQSISNLISCFKMRNNKRPVRWGQTRDGSCKLSSVNGQLSFYDSVWYPLLGLNPSLINSGT